MIPVGLAAGDFLCSAFLAISMYMVHSLYPTPRKLWQCVIAWSLLVVASPIMGALLQPFMPGATLWRIHMIDGFFIVLVYDYLFPQIVRAQRYFTVLFVASCMYELVLVARVISLALARTLPFDPNLLLAAAYIILAIAFIVVFQKYLKRGIIRVLAMFEGRFVSLTFLAGCCYVTQLSFVDVWAPWQPMTIPLAFAYLIFSAFTAAAYYVAFRTLGILTERATERADAKHLKDELGMAERYYNNLLDRISATRTMNHDMRYHVVTLAGLAERGRGDEARAYAEKVVGLPDRFPVYCEVYELNVLLDHYAGLCRDAGIRFDVAVGAKKNSCIQPLHLCVIFGNALQNAYEACNEMLVAQSTDVFIELTCRTEGDRLVLRCANSFTGVILEDSDGCLRSTKAGEDHGFGVDSIRQTAGLYDGWCSVSVEDDEGVKHPTFVLSVVLVQDLPEA